MAKRQIVMAAPTYEDDYEDLETEIETLRAENANDQEIVDLCNAMLERSASDRSYLMLMDQLGLDADDCERLFAVLARGMNARREFKRTTEVVNSKFGWSLAKGEIL